RFFKRDILARFGIPQVVVTDNRTQFTDKKFREFLITINTSNTLHLSNTLKPMAKPKPQTESFCAV
ncbi:hypothetical protein A2U01_0106169, partial [Trifolium medium]|nr:hypothetical protein [Trifolium medium]